LLCGHHHVVPIENFAMQEFHGQWVLYKLLDGTLERPSAVVRVIALS